MTRIGIGVVGTAVIMLLASPSALSASRFKETDQAHSSSLSSQVFKTALSSGQISQKAKQVTVMIQDDFSTGSGIIIQQDKQSYTVLTAAHVVSSPDATYTITTTDQQQYKSSAAQVKRLAGVDMAILTFQSDRTYPLAKIASSNQLSEGVPVYVAGFPASTAAITVPVYNFTDGKVTARSSKPFQDGYAMVYTNKTLPGMSGGGVFDGNGNLVGIHGRGDVDSKLESSNINAGVRVKTGFNLGIPIDTFVSRASEVGIILKINLPTTPVKSNPVDDFVVSATIKAQQGNYNGAIQDISRAIQQSPREARLYMARANYYSAMGQTNTAVEDLNQAIKLDPTIEQAYWLRGSYRQANRDTFGALEDFSKVIELNPDNQRAYLMRATIHVTQTDYAGAIADYSQIIRIDPKNTLAYSQRAGMKFAQGDREGALKDYSKLIALNPRDTQAYDQRAHIRKYNGDPKGAIEDYQAIARLNPRSTRAYSNIADLKEDMNDLEGAIAAYSKLIQVNPRETSALYERAQLYEKQNQYQKAIADYTQLIKLQPFMSAWYISRGYAREKFGDKSGAKADFLKLAELARKKGDLDEAKSWTGRANNL